MALLCDLGWDIVRLADVSPDDAQRITDEEYVALGGREGMALLTKDKRIRYQPSYRAATTPVFALSDGGLGIDEMVARFDSARSRIWTAAAANERQFWIVYAAGRIARQA